MLPASTVPGAASVVVRIHEDGSAELVHRSAATAAPNHNVVEHEGELIFCDTNANGLRMTAACAEGPERFIAVPGSPGFVRGLARVSDHEFLVGSQCPAAVHRIDIEEGRVVTSLPLEASPSESVYGITIVPDRFGDPPADLGLSAPLA